MAKKKEKKEGLKEVKKPTMTPRTQWQKDRIKKDGMPLKDMYMLLLDRGSKKIARDKDQYVLMTTDEFEEALAFMKHRTMMDFFRNKKLNHGGSRKNKKKKKRKKRKKGGKK